jgi:hypothetical protein
LLVPFTWRFGDDFHCGPRGTRTDRFKLAADWRVRSTTRGETQATAETNNLSVQDIHPVFAGVNAMVLVSPWCLSGWSA